ncbi:MAG: NERD domain-containing protein [Thiotrichaceae bacterium]|nr:NERD domain-containing protein [Thiotrichaceae bacterium]
MNDLSQVNAQLFAGVELISAVSFFAIAFIFYLNRIRIKQSWLLFRTQYCLNHLGLEQISDIQFPDGLGHHFTIDRLLLRHNGITLLVYKKYPGRIFCASNIDEWTQMLGQKSYAFKNPLFELDYQIKAISAFLPDIPIDGFLFFDHTTQFPKGHPQRVMHPRLIPEELQRNNRHQVEPVVMDGWRKMQELKVKG